MDIEIALSIARSTERAGRQGEEETVMQVLADEVIDLRKAARLIHDRRKMVSGSLEMGDCDEFCKNCGLEVWAWPL